MSQDIKILSEKTLADAWGKLSETRLEMRRRDGTWQKVSREVYDHGSAAAVLLCDPAAGNIILTRQFRYPPFRNGDPGWLIEACAGLLDGDTPEACARREAEEETGYRPDSLIHAFAAYASPGSLTEKVECFIGLYGPVSRISDGGGLHHEGEDIEVLEMPFAEGLAMIRDGRIVDAKTIMLLQHAALSGIFASNR
ncbi:GDP-mannose pyrophosphatase [Devosia sp. 17-2-E-8]|nr:GDP-mannose pyrophosphatase [Devosia sp. 17-2-E-8]